MAEIDNELQELQDGVNWEGHTGQEVETYLKNKLQELDNNVIGGISVLPIEDDEDNSRLTITNRVGSELASALIPKGGKISGNSIVITANVNNETTDIKVGEAATLSYKFDAYVGEEAYNGRGDVIITITTPNNIEYVINRNIDSGQQDSISLSEYTSSVGRLKIYIQVYLAFPGEEVTVQPKQIVVNIVDLKLTSNFNPLDIDGQNSISVPFKVTGSGIRTLNYYLDGAFLDSKTSPETSNSWNSAIYLPKLNPGKHNLQLVAQKGGFKSNSLYIDFFVRGSNETLLGIITEYADGRIYEENDPISISAKQFTPFSFDIIAYNPNSTSTDVKVFLNSNETTTINVPNTSKQTYNNTFQSTDPVIVTLAADNVEYSFTIEVGTGEKDVRETEPVKEKLTATGRSNSDKNKESWGEGSVFTDFNWSNNGWIRTDLGEDVLRLTNGAKVVTGLKPFTLFDPEKDSGLTIEMEFFVNAIMDRTRPIISCGEAAGSQTINGESYERYKGIKILAEKAGCYTGRIKTIKTPEEDDQGNPIINVASEGVEMSFASKMWVKVAFIIHSSLHHPYPYLIELYINGVRSKADLWEEGTSWNINKGIIFDSRGADIDIRNIRIYNKALEDFEVLNNYMADRTNSNEIKTIFDRNNVISDGAIDFNLLRKQGKGVMVLVRSGGIDEINATNDKKADFVIDEARWYAPSGEDYGPDFIAQKFFMRIQGTSSTKYARKNYRLYLNKGEKINNEPQQKLYIKDAEGSISLDNSSDTYRLQSNGKYGMRTTSKPVNLFCLKCDYSDSSMVLNTGGAKLYDSIMRQLELYTPAQREDSMVRQAIDGIPCDLFIATDTTLANITYLGQYNFNNEKSKSQDIFGMTDGSIVLESLNNGNPFCLFQCKEWGNDWDNDDSLAYRADITELKTNINSNKNLTDAEKKQAIQDGIAEINESYPASLVQFEEFFDKGFEFNYPEDVFWTEEGAKESLKKDVIKPENLADDTQRNAIKRLVKWIYDCLESPNKANNWTEQNHIYESMGGLGRFNLDLPSNDPDNDYGNNINGWSITSKQKWVSDRFKDEINNYFDKDYLLTYYLITEYWGSVDQRAKNILWRTWDGEHWYPTYYDGDTSMGMRNDATLVYNYDMTRDTWDLDHNKYAYEGHDSWLWCLVLANFENELRGLALTLRNKLTNKVMENMFTSIQQNNWCETLYNKSGEFKYIIPQIVGVPLKEENHDVITEHYKYTNMYALTGNRESQRTLFIRERGMILDAKYTIGDYFTDVASIYIGLEAGQSGSITITSNGRYTYGHKFGNTDLTDATEALDNDTVTFTFYGPLSSASEPVALLGASHFGKLDLTQIISHVVNEINLSKCGLLREIDAHLNQPTEIATTFNISGCRTLEKINVTNISNVAFSGLNTLTRLREFKAGNTLLTTATFAIGAPLEEVVLPATLGTLCLRGHQHITNNTLTLQGTSNIRNVIITDCPNFDTMAFLEGIMGQIDNIRINGLKGTFSLDTLLSLKDKGGYTSDSNLTSCNYPTLLGEIWLDRVASNEELNELNQKFRDLTIHQPEYSHYWFDDKVTDPCNITNEDNGTSFNNYRVSGHVSIIHDKCQVVAGYINSTTHKMHVVKLNKSSFNYTSSGDFFDLTDADGNNYDIFLYLPHYWYKGVNDFKNSCKHFYISSNEECPSLTGNTQSYKLSTLSRARQKGLSINEYNVGEILTFTEIRESIPNSSYVVCQVDVEGKKLVRFPSIDSTSLGHIFTTANGTIISKGVLDMDKTITESPTDFINQAGDYEICEVPNGGGEEAKYLYFTCLDDLLEGPYSVYTTDSEDIEALEPDWVEHKAELIGIYSGYVSGIGSDGGTPKGGLRSISGKTISRGKGGTNSGTNPAWTLDENGIPKTLPSGTLWGTAEDFLNLALFRNYNANIVNGNYIAITYETMKDVSNLLMVWFGTRDIESIIGYGNTLSKSITTGYLNNIAFEDTYIEEESDNKNIYNKAWGLEFWTGTVYEWIDNICFNASSFRAFKVNSRRGAAQSNNSYCILQQDGSERKVMKICNSGNVLRVRFGRYCDIIAGSTKASTTYANGYAAKNNMLNDTNYGASVYRSGTNGDQQSGLVYMSLASSPKWTPGNIGTRLCFQGEIENEEILK